MRHLTVAAALVAMVMPAIGADQNAQRIAAKAPPIATPSPFYVGAWAGVGFSKTESELTIPGVATGPVGAYPTGIMPGLTLGYASNSSAIYWGAAIDVGYDFSQSSVGGVAPAQGGVLAPIGYRKNGFFVDEVAEIGINASTVGGYIPANAQPQNWAVPITVPTSVWSNLIFAVRGGFAQRDIQLCTVVDPVAGTQACGTKFINGPLVGAKIKAMISAQTEVFATYDHVFWNSSFTPAGSVPAFASTISAKDEDLFRAGFAYHFTYN